MADRQKTMIARQRLAVGQVESADEPVVRGERVRVTIDATPAEWAADTDLRVTLRIEHSSGFFVQSTHEGGKFDRRTGGLPWLGIVAVPADGSVRVRITRNKQFSIGAVADIRAPRLQAVDGSVR